jgi:hypothetical protein
LKVLANVLNAVNLPDGSEAAKANLESIQEFLTFPNKERWVIAKEIAVDTGLARPELMYALYDGSTTFDSFESASYAIREAELPIGFVAIELNRLIPNS